MVRVKQVAVALLLSTNLGFAQAPPSSKQAPLQTEAPAAAANPVSGNCVILTDNSMQIRLTNSSSRSYSCQATCNLRNNAGNTQNIQCNGLAPASANDIVLCSHTGNFTDILGGTLRCQ